jgi:hypothetical protein
VRVYLPATLPGLRDALGRGVFGPAPVTAYAVTPHLREWYATGDAEELEYAASQVAARASLRLLARDPAAPARRVVVAVDVSDASVSSALDLHRSAVLVGMPVPAADIVSVHVDAPAAAAVISAAAGSILAADAGDEDAGFVVDEADAEELQWFAAQELDGLIAE